MKKTQLIYVLILCIALSGCSNNRGSADAKPDITDDFNSVNETKEVTCLANLYNYIVDEKTGKEKYGLLLQEPFVYKGEELTIGASLYIANDMIDEDRIEVLCVMLLDGVPVKFSMNDSEQSVIQNTVVQNGLEEKVKLSFKPYGVSNSKKNLVFIGIPFAGKQKTEVYENSVLFCAKEIVSENGSLRVKKQKPQYAHEYIDSIAQIKEEALRDTDNSCGEEQYVNDFIFLKDSEYYFASELNEGHNETILFCDGKLYPGFGGSEYFSWNGNEKYVNMKIDTDKLSVGKHIIFAVTMQEEEGLVTVNKSLNREVDINE